MRRIHYLTCAVFGLNGVFFCATEVSAPPCTDIRRVVTSVGYAPVIACHSTAERLLNTLYHNKCMGICIENGISAFCSGISPVVLIGRAVPFCGVYALLTFSVGFVLEVKSEESIIVLILFCEPCSSFNPHISRNRNSMVVHFLAVPEVINVT